LRRMTGILVKIELGFCCHAICRPCMIGSILFYQ